MRIKTIISSLSVVLALTSHAQTTQKLSASKTSEYGLIYSLPTTVVDITIETEHVAKAPGEFYNYARRYLGVTDAIVSPSETTRIKSVVLTTRGVADPDNRWLVQFKSGSTPYMILNDANLPLALNTEDVPETVPTELPKAEAAGATPLETDAARHAVTLEMTQSSSISKRAELAAQRIFELRESRNDLISGQAENTPPDGKSLQLALDNLTAQEAALTAMFAGTEKRWTDVNTVTFVPDSDEVTNKIIARLSPIDGIVEENDLTGSPIYLSMEIVNKGEMPVNDKGEPKRFPKGGVSYNIPGTAIISLKYDGMEIARKEVELSQLGVTFGLDPGLFTDKKAPAFLHLSPVTGAIMMLGTK